MPKLIARRPGKPTKLSSRPWERIRKRQLSRKPLCEDCEQRGTLTEATQVDHVLERAKGGGDEWENLRSLCAPCHEAKTSAMNIPEIAEDGWPKQGGGDAKNNENDSWGP